jgi:hypothetical protein
VQRAALPAQVRQFAEKGWNIVVVEGVICLAFDTEAA